MDVERNKEKNGNINLGYVVEPEKSVPIDHPTKVGIPPDEDPWILLDIKTNEKPPFKELSCCGKIQRALWDWSFRYVTLILTLYLFICSIGFLGSAFQLLGGKTVGEVFRQNDLLSNPIAGLMIGVLATVLVQSSSTTTSIIVTMVAAQILEVEHAVYIVMGANIGTSVTNTIVALGQISNKAEFRRAFAGATVHDMFNWLTVIILLPLEAATGYLKILSKKIVESTGLEKRDTKRDILKVITKPFTSLVISIDKKKIYQMTEDPTLTFDTMIKTCCKKTTEKFVDVACENVTDTGNSTCFKTVCETKCKFMFQEVAGVWSDSAIGAVLLVIALMLMCICLVVIVKLLQSILQGHIAKVIHKFINADFPGYFAWLTGYVAILLGAGMTILVQSSSIFTSSITPLVGCGVITIYRMYPLTLGANIGTTFTGVLAALSVDSDKMARALQISMCHLFFNISGILIFYPIPFMRKIPIMAAKKLGDTTAKYRWFAIFYLLLVFFLIPAAIFGLSLAGWYVLAGVLGPVFLVFVVVLVINVLQTKRASCLPEKLRTWNFLPLWMHSLRPLNGFFQKYIFCCKTMCKSIRSEPTGVVTHVTQNTPM